MIQCVQLLPFNSFCSSIKLPISQFLGGKLRELEILHWQLVGHLNRENRTKAVVGWGGEGKKSWWNFWEYTKDHKNRWKDTKICASRKPHRQVFCCHTLFFKVGKGHYLAFVMLLMLTVARGSLFSSTENGKHTQRCFTPSESWQWSALTEWGAKQAVSSELQEKGLGFTSLKWSWRSRKSVNHVSKCWHWALWRNALWSFWGGRTRLLQDEN